ncbi:MAG: DUF5703 domain-containing protein [Bacteroidota bacterium]|nr:DUF5703 domain-containing protein [Bacteroidota bacterium]
MNIIRTFIFGLSVLANTVVCQGQPLASYNVSWTSQSKNVSESMPVGGGDIGCNVWVENGELLFYISRSGTFDENNMFPKLGRIRIKLLPNPFDAGSSFKQELKLKEGYIEISGVKSKHKVIINVWVDVFRPVVNVNIDSNEPVSVKAAYESWRVADREVTNKVETHAFRAYSGAPVNAIVHKDEISFNNNNVLFFHRNQNETVFDLTVKQQGLDSIKAQLWNPLAGMIFGGMMFGQNMVPEGTVTGKYLDTDYTAWQLKSATPVRKQSLQIVVHQAQPTTYENWLTGLNKLISDSRLSQKTAWIKTKEWWQAFWDRSYIFINPDKAEPKSPEWQVGRNYQLFRYQLGCNAFGNFPTKFNGGLFTFDPSLTRANYPFSPDFRCWGGGSATAQNQRLVYWPMLKSGDFEMMPSQFNFYLRALKNVELRTKAYWGHKGASFCEQIESFGLPVAFEYGWKRPATFDKGEQYNAWIDYYYDTVLEFCLMILDLQQFTGEDISKYMPLIESSVVFFDEHYQYLAKMRDPKALDENGHLVLYPGTACETYKMATNAVPTISGLKTVLIRMLELPDTYASAEKREQWKALLQRIPPLSFREIDGHKMIAPAKTWERINNDEKPQLYPVFPYGIYGIGKPDLDVAINTWKYDPQIIKSRDYVSWNQDGIFCARLGLTDEAADIAIKKLQDSPRRFPTFWGPGRDWVPDHNWGGSGMIGLQEMLMQTDGRKIFLFPAWPKKWDVTFKLHAPYNTTVEGSLINGKITNLKVTPESRRTDIVEMQ